MNVTPDVSFGGRKQSGIGRQMGSATIAGCKCSSSLSSLPKSERRYCTDTDVKILRIPKRPEGTDGEGGTDED